MFARRAATGKFVESGITADGIRVPRACFECAFNYVSLSLFLSLSAPVVWSYPHHEFLGISLCTVAARPTVQKFHLDEIADVQRTRLRQAFAILHVYDSRSPRDDFITVIIVETYRDYQLLTTLTSKSL